MEMLGGMLEFVVFVYGVGAELVWVGLVTFVSSRHLSQNTLSKYLHATASGGELGELGTRAPPYWELGALLAFFFRVSVLILENVY